MSEPGDTTARLQNWINRIQAGDDAARDELLAHFERRLRHRARRQLRRFAEVQRYEQTDDVFVNATMRLLHSLEQVRPASVKSFLNLASEHIRRELIDLYRHHYGPEGQGAHHATTRPPSEADDGPSPMHDRKDTTWEPGRLAELTELHEKVATLPDKEREVFDLLWYQELTQDEAAVILKVSHRTIIRQYQSAKLLLRRVLKGSPLED